MLPMPACPQIGQSPIVPARIAATGGNCEPARGGYNGRYANPQGGAEPVSRDAVGRAAVGRGPRRWLALYTKSRQEKSLARELFKCGIPFYLPLVRKTNVSRGRKRTSLVPLFGGYVFLYGSEEERVRGLTTGRISRVLEVEDADQLVFDLRQLRQLIKSDAPLTVESRLSGGPVGPRAARGVCRAGRDRGEASRQDPAAGEHQLPPARRFGRNRRLPVGTLGINRGNHGRPHRGLAGTGKSGLEQAMASQAEGRHEWACFAAQQAAEKAVKGLHLAMGQDAWGHVIARLLAELPFAVDQELVEKGRVLDNFYVPTRYANGHPGRRSVRALWSVAKRRGDQLCP